MAPWIKFNSLKPEAGQTAGAWQRAERGLTILEVLVAIALLGIIILVVVTPLTGFFGLTRRSNQQVDATQVTQQAVEIIRGEWQNPTRYQKACLVSALPVTTPALGIQVTNLDLEGNVLGMLTPSSNCSASTLNDSSPLRRVQVTRTDSTGKVLSTLAVEVPRP